MSVVSAEQREQFEELGYVLLSGLIGEVIAAKAAAALWRGLGASPDDATAWQNIPVGSVHKSPEVLAAFTPAVRCAAAELSGEGLPELPLPESTFTLNIFPQEGQWSHHGPHIDHALEKDGFRVFPRPMRIASIVYLNDVPRHGAPTVVWPRSYHKIEALAKQDPERYALMSALNADLGSLELGEAIEVPGKMGDILFYHYLTAHAGSRNATACPRLALVHKW